MPAFHDQLNREILLPAVPTRIISVVPSQTELLFYLGLNEEVIGITKFCIHPADKFKSTTKIGGTKQLDLAKIKALQPDLIIANKEENDRSQVEKLMAYCPVWISDISCLAEATDMIERVGCLAGKAAEAKTLSDQINQRFNNLAVRPTDLRVAYLIWRKPYMVAGKGTFIDDMLRKCGFINAFESERYPEITVADLVAAKPGIVFLSSEPYPFKEEHIRELKAVLPSAVFKLVDGEMFSWYGNRLSEAPCYFEQLTAQL